jgi:hypothetical protein
MAPAQFAEASEVIRFKAKLLRPAEPAKGNPWSFLILPRQASAKLPTRGKLREGAGIAVGDVVQLEILPLRKEPEPRTRADLRKALAAAREARAVWSDITPAARARRIRNACAMLAAGKRRVCCFDRSGFYSKSFSAPKAAE